jgi:hypothetical protein
MVARDGLGRESYAQKESRRVTSGGLHRTAAQPIRDYHDRRLAGELAIGILPQWKTANHVVRFTASTAARLAGKANAVAAHAVKDARIVSRIKFSDGRLILNIPKQSLLGLLHAWQVASCIEKLVLSFLIYTRPILEQASLIWQWLDSLRQSVPAVERRRSLSLCVRRRHGDYSAALPNGIRVRRYSNFPNPKPANSRRSA